MYTARYLRLPLRRLSRSRRGPGMSARGMTLVEVLLASAILVFGMVGVISIIAAATRTHKRAVDETQATQVGMTVLAELRGLCALGTLPVSTPITEPRTSEDYPNFRYGVVIKDLNQRLAKLNNPLIGREVYVEVHVLWGPTDEPKTAVFRTVMFLRPKADRR